MFKERFARFIKKEVLTLVDHAIVLDFNREVEACFEYFERNGPNFHEGKHSKLRLIHGNRVEIGKTKDKEKEYFLKRDSSFEQGYPFFSELYKVDKGRLKKSKRNYSENNAADFLNLEPVDRKGLEQIIKEIHNITIPYREHIESKPKNKH